MSGLMESRAVSINAVNNAHIGVHWPLHETGDNDLGGAVAVNLRDSAHAPEVLPPLLHMQDSQTTTATEAPIAERRPRRA